MLTSGLVSLLALSLHLSAVHAIPPPEMVDSSWTTQTERSFWTTMTVAGSVATPMAAMAPGREITVLTGSSPRATTKTKARMKTVSSRSLHTRVADPLAARRPEAAAQVVYSDVPSMKTVPSRSLHTPVPVPVVTDEAAASETVASKTSPSQPPSKLHCDSFHRNWLDTQRLRVSGACSNKAKAAADKPSTWLETRTPITISAATRRLKATPQPAVNKRWERDSWFEHKSWAQTQEAREKAAEKAAAGKTVSTAPHHAPTSLAIDTRTNLYIASMYCVLVTAETEKHEDTTSNNCRDICNATTDNVGEKLPWAIVSGDPGDHLMIGGEDLPGRMKMCDKGYKFMDSRVDSCCMECKCRGEKKKWFKKESRMVKSKHRAFADARGYLLGTKKGSIFAIDGGKGEALRAE